MKPRSERNCVVVGVDGSTNAFDALDWATRAATARGMELLIVHVQHLGPAGRQPVPRTSDADARRVGAPLVSEAEAFVRTLDAGPPRVSTLTMTGDPSTVLTDVAEHARMLVVGTRGLSGYFGLPLGSTAHGVAERSMMPAVLVPTVHTRPRRLDLPVVLGLESTTGENAVEFAFDMAAYGANLLRAIHVGQPTDAIFEGELSMSARRDRHWSLEFERWHEAEYRSLTEQISGWSEKYPDVRVERSALVGPPAGLLSREARDAALVVVGGRRQGPGSAALHGAVTRGLLEHTGCPVAAVHDDDAHVGMR